MQYFIEIIFSRAVFFKTAELGFVLCMVGCATVLGNPKPPECKGEYRPVNMVEQKGASFDGSGKVVRCEDRGQHGKAG